ADLTYDYTYLGAGPDSLKELESKKKAKAERPMFIVGPGAYARKDGAAVMASAAKAAKAVGVIRDDWNGFNVLHSAAARVGGLDLGFVPGEEGRNTAAMIRETDVLILLGADELDMTARKSGSFTIYVGHHGDVGAHHADVILPGAAYTEKSGTWVNTEGRVQMGNRAAFPPGEAREDWAILRALSDRLGKTLPFDSLAQLRGKLYEVHPHFMELDEVPEIGGEGDFLDKLAERGGATTKEPFLSPIDDFYLTNPIARASKVMAECSQRMGGEMAEAAE
ncbi:MAG: molybdopterin-dependent oxidoreductase, partial [Pseudomonadota bacterium]